MAHALPPTADRWPANPAPDAWVKVDAAGQFLCKTHTITNSIEPTWNRCCDVPHYLPDAIFRFTVFDADSYAEGNLLGAASLPMGAAAGDHVLTLTGGLSDEIVNATAAALRVYLPYTLSPPPPPPPSPLGHFVPGPAKYLCVNSASGLPLTDFYLDGKLSEWSDSYMAPMPDAYVIARVTPNPTTEPDAYKTYYKELLGHLHMVSKKNHIEGTNLLNRCESVSVKSSVNPSWEYCCNISAADPGAEVIIGVFDQDDKFEQDDFIGSAVLPVSSPEGAYTLPLTLRRPAEGYGGGSLSVTIDHAFHSPVEHFEEDCWDECAASMDGGGNALCPGFCGAKGACCRNGFGGLGCPGLDTSCGVDKHCCIRSAPLPAPSAPPSPPSPPAPPMLEHAGADCWYQCGETSGYCLFCGGKGACCRAGDPAAGCPIAGAPADMHACVAAAPLVDVEEFLEQAAELKAEASEAAAASPVAGGGGGGVIAAGVAAVGLLVAGAAARSRRRQAEDAATGGDDAMVAMM